MKTQAHNILLVLLALMLYAHAGGQPDFYLKAGKPVDFDPETASNLYAADSSYCYLLRLSNKGCIEFNTGNDAFIEAFDKGLNPDNSIRLTLNSPKKYRRLQPIVFHKTNDGYLILCKFYTSANKIMKAFLIRADDTGHVNNELKVVAKIENVEPSLKDFHFFDLKKIFEGEEARYVLSISTPAELLIPERINFLIFDEQLNLIGERLIDFPDDVLDYEFSEILSGIGGPVFFRIEVTNPYFPEKTVHQLIVYDVFKDRHQSFEFEFEQGKIAKAGLFKLEENKIGLTGYYTKDDKSDEPAGVFYYVFDPYGGSLLRQKIFNLTEDGLNRIGPGNLESKSGHEHLCPKSIHLSTNNNIVLAFEYNWKDMMLIRDQEGKLYPKQVFKANEIIIFNFSPTDAFINMGIIPKQQLLNSRQGYLGFFSFLIGQELMLIYNDHPKNLKEYQGNKLKTMKTRFGPVIVNYNINKSTYLKKPLEFGKSPCICKPHDVIKLSENSMLFLNKGTKSRLIKIGF